MCTPRLPDKKVLWRHCASGCPLSSTPIVKHLIKIGSRLPFVLRKLNYTSISTLFRFPLLLSKKLGRWRKGGIPGKNLALNLFPFLELCSREKEGESNAHIENILQRPLVFWRSHHRCIRCYAPVTSAHLTNNNKFEIHFQNARLPRASRVK